MKIQEILTEWSDDILTKVSNNPEFKAWFGKSKVIDANGNPLPAYHYTNVDFNINQFKPFSHFGTTSAANARWKDLFRIRNSGPWGRHMHDDSPYWDNTHQIIPVFLKIEKPFIFKDRNVRHSELTYINLLYKNMLIDQDEHQQLKQEYTESDETHDRIIQEKLISIIHRNGYDGMCYKNSVEGKGSYSWVILQPSQVRSVFEFIKN